MAVAQIKGAIIKSRLEFVRTHGADKLEAVFQRLSIADQAILRSMILAVAWYPFDLGQRLDQAIAEVLTGGDWRQVFVAMGRASADVNLTGVHSAFVLADDPHYLLDRSPGIYRQYYDKGRRTYERTGEHSGILRTFEAEDVTAEDCLTVVGWYERGIELSGGKNVKVEETMCRVQGHDHCEYVCAWE